MHPIQTLLDEFIRAKEAVGVSALVMKDGREAFFGCAGRRTLEADAPFDRETILRVYSMTKIVVSAAVMKLMEQGLLTPDTPVYEILPEYQALRVRREDGATEPVRTPLTIHHLLTMTSGIPYPYEYPFMDEAFRGAIADYADPLGMTTLEMARRTASCPLLFHPGDRWLYGMGTEVLGGIIVLLTGMELGPYLKKTFFDPLGMKDTCFRMPEEKLNRLAGIYKANEENELIPYQGTYYDRVLGVNRVERAGGGLYSTLDDFARFGEMLRCGGAGLLAPESVRRMSENHLTDAQLPTYYGHQDGYGYGYLVRSLMDEKKNARFRERSGCFGWNGMAGTTLRIDPARGLTVVFGVQRANYNLLIPRLMQTIDQSIH